MVAAWTDGLIDDGFMEPDPLTWFKENKKPGVFVDHALLTFISIILGHDLVIVHMNPSTVENKMFRWIQGIRNRNIYFHSLVTQ